MLSAKLPNGQYAVPTPQITRKTGANVVGLATVSDPLTFNESQGLASVDYLISAKNTFTAKWFWDQGNLITPYTSTLPTGGSNAVTGNSLVSGRLTTLITTNLINEARFSYNFTRAQSSSLIPFTTQQLGIASSNPTNSLPPVITVNGLFTSFGGTFTTRPSRHSPPTNTTTRFPGPMAAIRFGPASTKSLRICSNARAASFADRSRSVPLPIFCSARARPKMAVPLARATFSHPPRPSSYGRRRSTTSNTTPAPLSRMTSRLATA